MTSSRLSPAELGTRVGQEIGTSSWITVDGEEKPALIAFSQVMLMS